MDPATHPIGSATTPPVLPPRTCARNRHARPKTRNDPRGPRLYYRRTEHTVAEGARFAYPPPWNQYANPVITPNNPTAA